MENKKCVPREGGVNEHQRTDTPLCHQGRKEPAERKAVEALI